ncbi:MAG TPA: N-acetylmuramic acid 6-phosphate etherase [Acholeplasmataceae bacterium]|jgi:N-acetylmuramic acid 6-phosphate etherase|nr:N-acetylmuramic acid 6-phosphate etherase [Acholeplasmataceae bacterium]
MATDLNKLLTEQRNAGTADIDLLPVEEILKKINAEDKTVALAVEKAIPQIAALVERAVEVLDAGGRLIYIGAGTSGRIGILDASECPPTFGVTPDTIQCLMAGGERAYVKSAEGAEDSTEAAVEDLIRINLTAADMVIGITASGRTPYAIAGVKYAKDIDCSTGSISTAANSEIAKLVDYPIEAVTGPEVIAGSTRMKSGTAQKLICNMISTTTMIKLGKVYQNLMIDVQPTNEKLVHRARNILVQAAGISYEEAVTSLEKYQTVKKALFSLLSGVEPLDAVEGYLERAKGNIRKALELARDDQGNRD